jgi:hypothetical protein
MQVVFGRVGYSSRDWSDYVNTLSRDGRREYLDCVGRFFYFLVRCDSSVMYEGYLTDYAALWIRSRRTDLFRMGRSCYRSFLRLINDFVIVDVFLWRAMHIDLYYEICSMENMRAFRYELEYLNHNRASYVEYFNSLYSNGTSSALNDFDCRHTPRDGDIDFLRDFNGDYP